MMVQINEVSAIAEQIMTPYVVMLDINATFKDVIVKMHQYNISAVFVEENTKNEYYIITKTDVIDFLNQKGMLDLNLPKISVKQIMQGPTTLIDVKTPIDTIIRFMIEHNYKRVLIGKDNKPVGVVSTKDIMQWNNTYFKPSKPQVLLFMDNINSIFIAKHIYEENIGEDVEDDLIDAYGGALTSISAMTDEILKKSGTMRQLLKDKRSILFEPYKGITGILISDYNSIELRRKLQIATHKFYKLNAKTIDNTHKEKKGISVTLDLDPIVPLFKENSNKE
jgi:CBS domain-containing protein